MKKNQIGVIPVIPLLLLILCSNSKAQLFNPRIISLSKDDCTAYGLFLAEDSLTGIFLEEPAKRHYSIVRLQFASESNEDGKIEKIIHLPNEFYDLLQEKMLSGTIEPLTTTAKKNKYFYIKIDKEDDVIGSSLTWEGYTISAIDEEQTITVPTDKINRIYTVSKRSIKNRDYQPDDPTNYRTFLLPTGRAKGKFGLGLSDYMVIFPAVNLSLPLNITVNAGLIPLDIFDSSPVWFAPKISFVNSKHYSLAVGTFTFMYNPDYEDFDESPMYSYVVQTIEYDNFALTTGLMFQDLHRDHFLKKKTLPHEQIHFMWGFEMKLAKSVKLMFEHVSYEHTRNFGIPGIRFYSDRTSLEMGVMLLESDGEIFVAQGPFVSFNFYLF